MRLAQRTGTTYADLDGKDWDVFDLNNIYAHNVKITAQSVYTTYNNGFVEVEFYGIEICKSFP